MIICTQGIEGKRLATVIKLTNKRVEFQKGKNPDVELTEDEEKAILQTKFPGWKLEKEKKTKKEVENND